MGQIYIPVEALKDRETFKDWYYRLCNQLFPDDKDADKSAKFKLTENDLEQVKLIERIMQCANLIYYGDYQLVPYKEKNRKLRSRYADIVGVAVYIIRNYYDINIQDIGKLFHLHHSSISYYLKKHGGLVRLNYKYKEQYLKLIRLLEDEKIIPIAQEGRPYTKQLLPTVLLGSQ